MAARLAFATLMALAAALFLSLGVWQVGRLSWKRDLIAHTNAKLAAAPVPAPGPALWPAIGPASAYTRVSLNGHYLDGYNTLVRASTRLGRGYWVMTPYQTDSGFTVFINRGFATDAQTAHYRTSAAPTPLTGLLRLTEPHGTLLQANKPSENRWYSRDVAALAAQSRLSAAPYFVDLDAGPENTFPVSGLTIVQFRNNHLQYALTWFALAALSLAGLGLILLKSKKD